jgi:hypothetical protein
MDTGINRVFGGDACHQGAIAYATLVERHIFVDGAAVPAVQIVEHDHVLALGPNLSTVALPM